MHICQKIHSLWYSIHIIFTIVKNKNFQIFFLTCWFFESRKNHFDAKILVVFKNVLTNPYLFIRISNYASVSTQTSVFIIGGWTNSGRRSSIVEFNDDIWIILGNLKQTRSSHQAILIGSLVMVVGGSSNDQL